MNVSLHSTVTQLLQSMKNMPNVANNGTQKRLLEDVKEFQMLKPLLTLME